MKTLKTCPLCNGVLAYADNQVLCVNCGNIKLTYCYRCKCYGLKTKDGLCESCRAKVLKHAAQDRLLMRELFRAEMWKLGYTRDFIEDLIHGAEGDFYEHREALLVKYKKKMES